MPVSIGWVLAQPELAVRLRGGAAGVDREIDLVVTTELERPYPWLSGGELVLTTGMRLPPDAQGRTAYVRGLAECGVSALGFGVGLTHAEVPPDLIAAADEIGIPLIEVPLSTAFAAIVKRVSARSAELQYDAVLRASHAQPRMTRALIKSGAHAIVRELAASLSATVVVLDPAGLVIDCVPAELDPALLSRVRGAVAGGTASGVRTETSGSSVTHQRIAVGRSHYGDLVVVTATPLGHVDQILLGHANSLLALDFEKPARLRAAQHRLNNHALGLLLGADTDPDPAWEQLADAADAHGRIRVLLAACDTDAAAAAVRTALEDVILAAGDPLFLHAASREVLAVLAADTAIPREFPRGAGDSGIDAHDGGSVEPLPARAADAPSRGRSTIGFPIALRKQVRLGVSAPHAVRELADAVAGARLAASAAERGGAAMEFSAFSGSSLLAFESTREVLGAMARTALTPLVEHDLLHGTDLLGSLRAFLEANGQWESAAVVTGVHRHTLRKRIATAGELLGCDLDNARVRAELLLAILARG
ncbi:PucR family transcriptional regulator ligand-binding domain-containing protein [Nocardia yamanashiensis]|uniref:PucR family transcriptional regulator n=1 Tax=Nocardia yamanashiensis TaxID=209247 RepID=UPI001E3AFBD4|nr:PucR family transcriptional regulator [Nocardia yamanashiensis]UGT44970.1 PucR family transcriptional regulator ligand-binding domain-containing protein [Nocardia yamanashiensis]